MALKVVEALEAQGEARAGVATCPADGIDLETLLSSAREAAAVAPLRDVALASQAFRTVALGDTSVLVADPVMVRLYALIERLAKSHLPVLVCGETGTGKELAARGLHFQSARRDQPLVTVNCAALQENLLESELFGHEKGAFTGADRAKAGLFETASGGTVFLDELGELSPAIQAKLLRAIESKRITRLGDTRERPIDIRIVAATHRDLKEEVRLGRFRQDLYFRLDGAVLWLPPLRDRKRELPILARAFLSQACARIGRAPMGIGDGAMQALSLHQWPGNVRELRNMMEYVAATVVEDTVEPWHLDARLGRAPARAPAAGEARGVESGETFRPIHEEVQELERTRMLQALHAHGWNQTRAADAIAMPLRTFVTKFKQYDLQRSR
ncbi:MAG: sigma-54-dependent Fis family transcriptional regulator [Archangiaceae bacterium]|nr:sigma-54-dependent Fis family transcriptional regulator [Archangiaceae bacterium]